MVNIFINIEDMFEMHEVIFEVYIEDKLSNRQQMQAPRQMLELNFIQTAQQIINDQRPIKLKMIREEIIWDDFEQKQKTLTKEIVVSNNAMVAWEENRKDGDNNE